MQTHFFYKTYVFEWNAGLFIIDVEIQNDLKFKSVTLNFKKFYCPISKIGKY